MDRELAHDPGQIIRKGGIIITVTEGDDVVGTCALFKENEETFELARMAVDKSFRGKGLGNTLMEEALTCAKNLGAHTLFLVSNTKLQAAIGLYRKYGFTTIHEGKHPSRCEFQKCITEYFQAYPTD